MSRLWPFAGRRRSSVPVVVRDLRPARNRPVPEAGVGQISEAKLHAYLDGALGDADRLNIETFLALRPDIAARIDAYRSQTVALHAAFGSAEEGLPPSLADLSSRLSRARRTSTAIALTLVLAGAIAMLLAALTVTG